MTNEEIDFQVMADLIEQNRDDMKQWELVCNRFRIIRKDGHVYGLMPTSRITISEMYLFKAATIKHETVCVDLLVEPNMDMFFMAAQKAHEEEMVLKIFYDETW
jgi:hypothetical protein